MSNIGLDDTDQLLRDRELIRTAQKSALEFAHRTPPPEANDDDSSAAHILCDSIGGYRITREIHRGGQGVVYQAVQQGTNRKVAIKVMRDGAVADDRERARFEREVHILAQL